ncbi:ATP-binding cassette domain-containing protein [Bosea sp. 47.2.35]|jgi:ABC-type glutathione transport system ATPase component|uniref:ATP-binding cassette domain-containing protein n=1 Tax=Bosea sp. 47.2.35 TaxID=2969304 RepID=UPI0021505D10|nr:ATP-binding cassette domain-containing protein [Bosea sp. 47.2.35]MCR4524611.1 ATP-binding cassette domain-containing protein [Bosea sp. 47.2.35]
MPVSAMTVASAPVLRAEHVGKTYQGRSRLFARGVGVTALTDVSFEVAPGEILGIVGESGCGKSTLARIIVGLEQASAGGLSAGDTTLVDVAGGVFVPPAARRIQMIFQDPYSSLNPRMKVGDVVSEGLRIAGERNRRLLADRVSEMLRLVGLPAEAASRYPFQFSGGQRQRIGIARALITEPRILIADEAVSALDVSVQMQILNLLLDIRDRLGIAVLFISHDIGVIEYLCDKVIVLAQGKIVESGTAGGVISQPSHPYTKKLIEAVPRIQD